MLSSCKSLQFVSLGCAWTPASDALCVGVVNIKKKKDGQLTVPLRE